MAYAAFVEPDTILDHPATRAEQGQDQAIIGIPPRAAAFSGLAE